MTDQYPVFVAVQNDFEQEEGLPGELCLFSKDKHTRPDGSFHWGVKEIHAKDLPSYWLGNGQRADADITAVIKKALAVYESYTAPRSTVKITIQPPTFVCEVPEFSGEEGYIIRLFDPDRHISEYGDLKSGALPEADDMASDDLVGNIPHTRVSEDAAALIRAHLAVIERFMEAHRQRVQ